MLQIKNLRKGMIFIERDTGCEGTFEALEDVRLEENPDCLGGKEYLCKAKYISGFKGGFINKNNEIVFKESIEAGCYCLDLELVSMP